MPVPLAVSALRGGKCELAVLLERLQHVPFAPARNQELPERRNQQFGDFHRETQYEAEIFERKI